MKFNVQIRGDVPNTLLLTCYDFWSSTTYRFSMLLGREHQKIQAFMTS
jgi:hypothetical protein